MSIEVRRLRPHEAETLKQTRLALLADSPSAFGSTLERELAFSDETWAERATASSAGSTHATFLACGGDGSGDGAVVGIVGGRRVSSPSGPIVELVSMWTAPVARRTGLGRRLVDAVGAWATETGAGAVELWVTRGNEAAERLYESLGFVVTGDHKPLPSDPCKDEVRMVLRLR